MSGDARRRARGAWRWLLLAAPSGFFLTSKSPGLALPSDYASLYVQKLTGSALGHYFNEAELCAWVSAELLATGESDRHPDRCYPHTGLGVRVTKSALACLRLAGWTREEPREGGTTIRTATLPLYVGRSLESWDPPDWVREAVEAYWSLQPVRDVHGGVQDVHGGVQDVHGSRAPRAPEVGPEVITEEGTEALPAPQHPEQGGLQLPLSTAELRAEVSPLEGGRGADPPGQLIDEDCAACGSRPSVDDGDRVLCSSCRAREEAA